MSGTSEHELDKLISNKEDEIKKIYYMKINSLNDTLLEKNKFIDTLEKKLEKLKLDFDFNYKLIEERDNDLKLYEDKIESFEDLIKEKEAELLKFKKVIDDVNIKLVSERNKRQNNEELLKFNISKLNNNHKEDIKNLNLLLEDFKKDILSQKEENKIKLDEIKYSNENEKRKFVEEIDYLKSQLKRAIENDKEIKLNKLIEDSQMNLNKINMENLNLIKEKIHIENKLKIYENNENETKTNNFVILEKNKYLTKDIEEFKLEISSKSHKIDNLNKIIEDGSTEIYSLKQKIQVKEFDLERKSLTEKLLNEKIRDFNFQIEKLIEDKRNMVKDNEEDKIKLQSADSKLRINNEEFLNLKYKFEKLIEENKKLLEEIEKLNKKIKEILNYNLNEQLISKDLLNLNLKEKNKEDTSEMLDFFNNKNNLNPILNNNQNPYKNCNHDKELREKEYEIERLSKELEGAKIILIKVESEMSETYNLFKENENKFLDKINKLELELIRKDIEIKNSINLSQSKDLKEDFNINEMILNYKTEIKLKTDLINKLKENLNSKISELNKIKKERGKMGIMCNTLRAQVNRIENQNVFGTGQDLENITYSNSKIMNNNTDRQFRSQNAQNEDIHINNMNNSILSSNSINLSEYEEYKKKKNFILNKRLVDVDKDKDKDRENIKIKEVAKRHIENVINKNVMNNERECSVKSNGIRGGIKNKNKNDNYSQSPNLRKAHLSNISGSNSKSRSRSISKSRSKSPMYNNYANYNENLLDAITISKVIINSPSNTNAVNGLKLLKRDREKNKY